MLDGLGQDRTEYLHTQRVVDIEHHMRRCKDCDATELCDNLLDTGQAIVPATAEFCPNMGNFRAAPR
jgi:hypothetical protein